MMQIFKEEDIEAGMFVINNTSALNSEAYSFAESVSWKICFKKTKNGNKYYLASVRDGMLLFGVSKKKLCKILNKKAGYRRLTKDEFLTQLNSSKGMRLE